MRVPYVKIEQSKANEEIERLRRTDELLTEFKIRRDGKWVMIPVKNSELEGEFESNTKKKMEHVGSFEKISDFYVIKEREGWEKVFDEIKEKQEPRAIFLDRGVEGQLRIRKLERIYGKGEPTGIIKENGFRYIVDLERAYFSPRLAGLRREITENCLNSSDSELVVDMYAGIGPISIPILKAGRKVLSMDVNPRAVELLSRNMRLNKVRGEVLIADSNRIFECLEHVGEVIMNNPTQPLSVTNRIIEMMESGTVIYATYISDRTDRIEFDGADVLERKIVHGYSPSSSLFYFRMRKK